MLAVILKFFTAVFLTIVGIAFVAVMIAWSLLLLDFLFRVFGFTAIAMWIEYIHISYLSRLRSAIRHIFKQ